MKKVFLTNKLLNCDCRLRIELLFNYHGDQYKIGETESREDATENEYASDTKTDIWLDPDTYEYGISADVYSYIPREDIKVLLGNLIEYFTDDESAKDVRKGLDTEFDSHDNISLGDRQKLTLKYITWDYRFKIYFRFSTV